MNGSRVGLLVRLEPLFTLEELADWLRIPLSRAEELVRTRAIPVIELCGEPRFHRDALRRWLRTLERVGFYEGPFGPAPVGLDDTASAETGE
jgi:hypothetical protein